MNIRGNTGSRAKNIDQLTSYRSANDFPQEAKKGLLFYDKINKSLLVPTRDLNGHSQLVPFRIETIKNSSCKPIENNLTMLRINFHVPGQGACSKDINFPHLSPGNIYIKELTFKSTGSNLTSVHNQLKVALKSIRDDDQMRSKNVEMREEDEHLADEPLILAKNKSIKLDNVVIKPTLQGKKTGGMLEAHCNGFRFNSTKG